jgi:hypothetical protein
LSTKAFNTLKDDRPLCTRPRQHTEYVGPSFNCKIKFSTFPTCFNFNF